MKIFRSAQGLVAHTPAKLNLFFEVLAKRSDGFHEIETLMAPIDLYDTLQFETTADRRIQVNCQWAEIDGKDSHNTLGSLPDSSNNLVTKALALLQTKAGVTTGATVRLTKRIPAAAGLGGGSSDAAAALVLGNIGWKLGFSKNELTGIAGQLGSDIPFFLYNAPAICRGRGEQIEKLANLGRWHAVVVRPPAGLSTAEVYARCRPANNPLQVNRLLDSLRTGNLRSLGSQMFNRLEPAAEQLSPWIKILQAEFKQLDAPAAQMSGSGSSYFGLCRSARQAQRLARQLATRQVGRVFVVSIIGT